MEPLSVVRITAAVILASHNVLVIHQTQIDDPTLVSMQIRTINQDRGYTVLGNIATGQILVGGNPLADPWTPMNRLFVPLP